MYLKGNCSKLISEKTARLALSLSANSSAGAFFQCKQLGWCFLSVQTARLVHCSKLISVKTARLALSFSANSSAGSL
jgi:hypothetical protein